MRSFFDVLVADLRYARDNEAMAGAGLAGAMVGLYSGLSLHLDLPDESLRPKVSTLFIQEMARHGVHCLTSFRATLAHTDDDIAHTAAAAYEAFRVIKHGLEHDALDTLLVCDVKREPFRRLVR